MSHRPTLEAERLLKAPDSFIRTKPKSSLLFMHSRKLRRRVRMVDLRNYDLAVHLECDPAVLRYNMEAPVQELVLRGETRVRKRAPAAASLDHRNALSIHTFIAGAEAVAMESADQGHDDASEDLPDDPWADWCRERGYRHVEWTPALLRPQTPLLENKKRLLRFVSRLGDSPDARTMAAIQAELRCLDRISVVALLTRLDLLNSDAALPALASLILDGRVSSSIAFQEFGPATELSVHHDIKPA